MSEFSYYYAKNTSYESDSFGEWIISKLVNVFKFIIISLINY